jgi:hypothetical protein
MWKWMLTAMVRRSLRRWRLLEDIMVAGDGRVSLSPAAPRLTVAMRYGEIFDLQSVALWSPRKRAGAEHVIVVYATHRPDRN